MSIDLPIYNTNSDFLTMERVFSGCKSLTSLDLSSLNTELSQNMDELFSGCKSLVYLDISNFSTSNVVSMNNMFYGCESLSSLSLHNFDTRKVIRMSYMLYKCSSLKYLDISSFTKPPSTLSINYFIPNNEGLLKVKKEFYNELIKNNDVDKWQTQFTN